MVACVEAVKHSSSAGKERADRRPYPREAGRLGANGRVHFRAGFRQRIPHLPVYRHVQSPAGILESPLPPCWWFTRFVASTPLASLAVRTSLTLVTDSGIVFLLHMQSLSPPEPYAGRTSNILACQKRQLGCAHL